jgi:hypothetical protein
MSTPLKVGQMSVGQTSVGQTSVAEKFRHHYKLLFFNYMLSYKGFASLTNMQADLVSSFTGGLNSDDKIFDR